MKWKYEEEFVNIIYSGYKYKEKWKTRVCSLGV